MTDRIQIAPERYEWALKRAGHTVDDYMNSHPQSGVRSWINGEKSPTYKQLENFAKSVHVPFGYLFLDTPPKEEIPIPMFRGSASSGAFDLNVYDTIMLVVQRQNWLEEYLPEVGADTCRFVNTMSMNDSIPLVVDRLRTILRLDERWAFGLATYDAAVNLLTERLEEAGVFLTYNGVVGNNGHRPISVDECRGFTLASQVAPYIFVNNSDSKSAQMFTLIHEMAHLVVGVSAGYAGANVFEQNAAEPFCDKVAAEFLVPREVLAQVWTSPTALPKLAKQFKVSEIVVARRAHDMGLLDSKAYREFFLQYKKRPLQKKSSKGGSFYRTSVKRIGRLFAIHVRNAVHSRMLSYTEAYRLTGLQGHTYNQFMTNNI